MSQSSTPQSADDCIQQGLAASGADRADEALALFQQAAQLAPQSGIPHFLIAAELAQAGRMDEAETAYANAVLLAPDLDMARFQLGLIQFSSNRAALALVTWEPLFRRPAESALQRIVHGFAALAQDDFVGATACFHEGMALNRDNPALNRDIQMILDRMASRTSPSPGPSVDGTADAGRGHAPAGAESEEEAGLHVLLANYQQQGPLH